jgi:hypothetical protein
MSDSVARDVRFLKRYAVVSSLLLVLVVVSAFRQQSTARFDVIETERINVVTKDGKLAVVMSNATRMPGNVIAGKEHPFDGSRGNGLLFYNRDGDEAGGLLMDNERRGANDSSLTAWGQLSIDRYGSDQVAALRYVEEPSGWVAALEVAHYPRGGLVEWHAARDSLFPLPPAQRDSALQQLRRRFFREESSRSSDSSLVRWGETP